VGYTTCLRQLAGGYAGSTRRGGFDPEGSVSCLHALQSLENTVMVHERRRRTSTVLDAEVFAGSAPPAAVRQAVPRRRDVTSDTSAASPSRTSDRSAQRASPLPTLPSVRLPPRVRCRLSRSARSAPLFGDILPFFVCSPSVETLLVTFR